MWLESSEALVLRILSFELGVLVHGHGSFVQGLGFRSFLGGVEGG